MKIRGMQIDGYGRFTDHRIDQLSAGLTVFLGQNEAGKSTLLAFIRAILFGFPEGRSSVENRYVMAGRARHGGRLFLEDDIGTEFTLERQAGKRGGIVRIFSEQREHDAAVLQQLLGSAGKRLFQNVFAFSLGELQQFDTLKDQEVTSALYSAGLGTSAAKLSKLEKDLASRAEELFKPNGSKPEINSLLKQLELVKVEKKKLQSLAGRFEELSENLEKLKAEGLERQARERALFAAEARTEKLLNAWPTWAIWHDDLQRLESLPAERVLPSDALSRLATLLERLFEGGQKESALRKSLEEKSRKLTTLPQDLVLLKQAETVRRLAGHRTEWDRLRQALPGYSRQEEALRSQLRQRLIEIHPDWQEETLRACDISVGRNEIFLQHQTALSRLYQEQTLAQQRLEEANKERLIAGQNLEDRRAELAGFSEPDDALAGVQESVLSDLRGRWRQSAEQARRSEQDHKIAAVVVADGLKALGSGWSAERVKRTDAHRHHSQQLLAHRESLTTRRAEAASLQSPITAWEKQLHGLAKEREAMPDQGLGPQTRSLAEIEDLRKLLFASRAELLRRESLRAAADKARTEARSMDFVDQKGLPDWLAGALILCGIVFAVPLLYKEETDLALFVLVFMMILAGLVHRVRSEAAASTMAGAEERAKRQDEARDQLAKVESELAALEHRLAEAAPLLAISSPFSPDDLDQLDRNLGKETAELERRVSLKEQRDRLEVKIADAESELTAARQAKQLADEASVNAYKDWKLWLTELELSADLTPDGARELLTDVQRLTDSVRRLEVTAAGARADLEQMSKDEQRLTDLLQSAGRTLQESNFDDQMTSFLADVRALGEKGSQRAQAQMRLREDERRWERAERNYDELARSLQSIQSALVLAEGEWQEARCDLPATTPETALEILRRARAAMELLDRAQAESIKCEEAESARDRIYQEVCGVFREAGRRAPGQSELTADFDRLLSDLQRYEKAEEERSMLQREMAGVAAELDAVVSDFEARKVEVGALYAQAGVQDEAAFRKVAEIERLRADYRQKIDSQEQTLTVAAGGTDSSSFFECLKSSNTDELELSLIATREERESVSQRLSEVLQEQGRIQSELEALQASDAFSCLRLREEGLKEQLRLRANEWAALALAEKLLEEARKTFERERQPDVLVRASSHFSKMTEGRYTRLIAPPGDSKVVMETASGERRESLELSRGTAEQAYLALRLGFVHEFSKRSETLPLVMDDIFVNFDPDRAKAAMREILTLTDRHQVLLFTCHPETVDRILEIHPGADVRKLSVSDN